MGMMEFFGWPQKNKDAMMKREFFGCFSMKYGCLFLILLALCAAPAHAENATAGDTVDSRMAGPKPHEAPPVAPVVTPAAEVPAATPSVVAPVAAPVAVAEPPAVAAPDVTASPNAQYDEALAVESENLPPLETIAAAHLDGKHPVIAIVIDDMGVDRKHSARAIKLPPQVTLSYLPYSTQIKEQTDAAKTAGHELLVHMPMQPDRASADPGPDYLGTQMSPLELHDRVEKNLAAFDGYVGINNHMGSKFTCDGDGIEVLMKVLEERKLMFLDSRTSPASVAETEARAHHLQTSHRDVFIDDDESPAAVAKSLARIERVAKHGGAAIAIGHPKDVTLGALEKWLPTLKEKGFELVPLSEVIALRSGPPAAVSAVASAVAAEPAPIAPVAAPEAAQPSAPLPVAAPETPKPVAHISD